MKKANRRLILFSAILAALIFVGSVKAKGSFDWYYTKLKPSNGALFHSLPVFRHKALVVFRWEKFPGAQNPRFCIRTIHQSSLECKRMSRNGFYVTLLAPETYFWNVLVDIPGFSLNVPANKGFVWKFTVLKKNSAK